MSLADVTSGISDASDHAAIIRHLARHDTEHGGWDEWSVACICGGLYRTTTDKAFIPSEVSAQRIYDRHLRAAGVLPDDEIQSELDEHDEEPDYEVIITSFAWPRILDVARACGVAGMTKRQVVSMLHQFANNLEAESE